MISRKNLVLIIASTGVFFEALDIAIVNLAMPLIQQYFGLANDQIQWVQTVYILMYGGFLLVGGKLADTIGRRKTFIIGNVLFLVTSAGAALSNRYEMLVAFRAIQGIGAAFMMPSALSIITNTFTMGPERARAIGIFGAFAAVGSGSGMSVGGLIATWFGWQSVFLINIPVISTTLLLTFIYIREDSRGGRFQDIFTQFVPRSLFRIPDAMLGAAVMLLLGAFFTGFLFLISMLLQNNMHYSPAYAGLLLFPFSILSAVTSKTALPYLMKKMLVHQAAILGMMLMVVGALLVVVSMTWNYNLPLLLISFACVSGVGMAICFTTLTVLSVHNVPSEHHGITTGLCTTTYFFGGGIGLGLLAAVMNESSGTEITQLPVVVIMMFAVAGVGLLLYFGGRNLSDASSGTGLENHSPESVNQEAA